MTIAASRPAESPKNKPAVIKRGSVTVKVYRGSRLVQGTEYPLFTVSYYNTDGKRIRRTFADERQAKEEAELTAAKLSRGQSDVLTLTGADREQYLQALESQPSHKGQNLTIFFRFPKEFCGPSRKEILSFSHGPAPLLDGTRCSGVSAVP